MSKVKVQEATKELSQGAGKLLEDVTRVRRNAQDLLQSLKKVEASFVQKEEEIKEQQLKEQQRQILSAQSKAWTMPDAEEVAAPEPAPKKETPAAENRLQRRRRKKASPRRRLRPSRRRARRSPLQRCPQRRPVRLYVPRRSSRAFARSSRAPFSRGRAPARPCSSRAA